MPKGSPERSRTRREEIIRACETLYETMSFKDITMKEISKFTSFTRPSIYNYFQTKEEIFLALLQREYERWIEQLRQIRADNTTLTRREFASAVAHSLERRGKLLKLLSMNHYDMEENSRMERLVEFKQVYGQTLAEMQRLLQVFFPEMEEKQQKEFLFSFFPFLFGVYPYTVVTEKQREAMQQAGVDYVYLSIYEIVNTEIRRLLGEQ